MHTDPVSMRRVWAAWWPLAASWLLMGIELPVVSAVMARLPAPDVNLAAYGGIVFPLALMIEAPVIMLLSTSTALSKDWASYVKLRRFSHLLGGGLSLLHALVAFTPLYDMVAVGLLDAPAAIVEPGRLGMKIMTPWTWAIASRRFQQGVLIRFGLSRAVGAGTLVRLLTGGVALFLGYRYSGGSGVAVASTAAATAVICEASYVMWRLQPVLRDKLRPLPALERPLRLGKLLAFHAPLALTSFLHLAAMPIGSAAMGRMPETLGSLATWPVINGLIFMFRSVGFAYAEVVVVIIERAGGAPTLRRFTALLAGAASALLLVVAATPIGWFLFSVVSALPVELARLAAVAVFIGVPLPALAVIQSWHQGVLVHGHRTRAVSEAVVLSLASQVLVLGVGIALQPFTGLYVVLLAALIANCVQATWLWWRGRPVLAEVKARDGM